MKKQPIVRIVAVCPVLFSAMTLVRAGVDDVADLMKLIPADMPVSIVAVDVEKFDKSLIAALNRLHLSCTDRGLAQMIRALPTVGSWFDLSKPIGMAATDFGAGAPTVVWARVPDFANRVKSITDAKDEQGVWFIPGGSSPAAENDEKATAQAPGMLFLQAIGDYVIASPSRELLALAVRKGRTLEHEFGPRMNLLKGRDLLVHVNFDPIRERVLASIAQAAQMAPMLAFMAAGQGGGDPQSTTAMFAVLIGAAREFVEQVAYIDVVAGVFDSSADITFVTGYKEGPIKRYLAAQKPAGVSFFEELEDRSFILAFGAHLPGDHASFLDWMNDKMHSALVSAPTGGKAGSTGNQVETQKVKSAARVMEDLLRKVEGEEVVVAATPAGLDVVGHYIGGDPEGILRLVKESLSPQQNATAQPNGVVYEPRATRIIAGKKVDQYRIKVDPGTPGAALLCGTDGAGLMLAFGIYPERVRFCLGDDAAIERAFVGKPAAPLSLSTLVVEALSHLPTKRNAVVLIDPAAALPMIGPMFGMPKAEAIPPGPPVAISISLSGEPARADIHIPFQAIERVMRAVKPEQTK